MWNGWGDYARKPELLTFDRAGDAELYGNTVLGLACRYYDFDRFRPLLNEFHRSAQEALYTDVFFLVLECKPPCRACRGLHRFCPAFRG